MRSWYSASSSALPSAGAGRGGALPSAGMREEALRGAHAVHQRLHIRFVVVDVERGARRRGDIEAPHQRLRAMVAGTDADAALVQYCRKVVRVDPLDGERDDTAPVRERGTVDEH